MGFSSAQAEAPSPSPVNPSVPAVDEILRGRSGATQTGWSDNKDVLADCLLVVGLAAAWPPGAAMLEAQDGSQGLRKAPDQRPEPGRFCQEHAGSASGLFLGGAAAVAEPDHLREAWASRQC